jgi:hypothetical protein
MTLRQNVRNFLVGLTVTEVQDELDLSVDMGDNDRAKYVEEFLNELLDECDDHHGE